MAKLGSPVSTDYVIGCAELRVGPLTEANMLTQANSVGLVDETTFTVGQESVDLEGGCPKTIVDTAIVSQTATITATAREYSRRNLQLILGEGVSATSPADVETTLAGADLAAGAAVVSVTDASALVAGDVIVIYPDNRPEDVTVAQIESIAVNDITLKTGQSTVADYNVTTEATTTFKVFKANQVAIGGLTKTNYFSVMLVGVANNTGRPKVVSFWKGAISGDAEISQNADDFASTSIEIKCLTPAATEYATGGDLEHIADLIPAHPTGMLAYGA